MIVCCEITHYRSKEHFQKDSLRIAPVAESVFFIFLKRRVAIAAFWGASIRQGPSRNRLPPSIPKTTPIATGAWRATVGSDANKLGLLAHAHHRPGNRDLGANVAGWSA